MLNENLFDTVLIEPAKESGINRLRIVSGFATAAMADKHMEHLRDLSKKIGIELIVGMTKRDGIGKAQHFAFQNLAKQKPYGMDFSCRYVVGSNPVHAKTYCWLKGEKPFVGFLGSANYTLTAFHKNQIETMGSVPSDATATFYDDIFQQTADCLDKNIEKKVMFSEARPRLEPRQKQKVDEHNDYETVTLSLLVKQTGETPDKSGINWGQRVGRDKNQAYINIPAEIGRSGFFPDVKEPFTVLTDDGESFIMVRAQDGGKGLETKQSNALLGEYLRARMGAPSGGYVTRQHLDEYGRTDVTFAKIDEETYLLNFQSNKQNV